MARTSTAWRLLPARELSCGSPATCWRRLTEWAKAGVFDTLHLQVLDRLGDQGQLDWEWVSVDSTSVRAKRGGDHVGANPVDRGKPGSKLQLVCDGGGLPLTAAVTAANVNDTSVLQAVIDDVPPIRTRRASGGPGRTSSPPIRAMTAKPTVPICAGVESSRGSLGVRSSRRSGLGATAGRSSAPCRG